MKLELKQEVFDRIMDTGEEIIEKGELLPLNRILNRLMRVEGVPIHGPHHHFIVPYTFLVAATIKENITKDSYIKMRDDIHDRSRDVPPGACGYYGACGAAIGLGIFISVYTAASPQEGGNKQIANIGTAKTLMQIASYPGARCCKLSTFTAIVVGQAYIQENLSLDLPIDDKIVCGFFNQNPTCIEEDCPYYSDKLVKKRKFANTYTS